MDKHEIARILNEISLLLAFQGENPFKIRAYQNAARTIESLDEDLETLIQKKELQNLPGIGAHIAEKITILVQKRRLPYYEDLKKSVPSGLLELLNIPGLGPKKLKILYDKLKIKSLEDLVKNCEQGKVAKLRGFGAKTQASLLNGVAKFKSYGKRLLWWSAGAIAQPILGALLKQKEVKRAEIAGSYRRKLETVGDLDFVASSNSAARTIDWFVKQPAVEKVVAKGPSKASVRFKGGLQADIRVVPDSEYAYALLYFTGSKEHNIELRKRALSRGFSLSEYGLEPLKKKTRPAKKEQTEEAIYQTLGLNYIPPELRENMGEIAAAEKGKLPKLIEERDIRGAFHCHTTDSDGHNTLEEMVRAACDLKWEYLGISDHSRSSIQAHGMHEEDLFDQVKRIRKLNSSGKFSTHVFAGLECDILPNGNLDFASDVLKELDFVIVSVHQSFKLDEKAMTARLIRAIENPYTTMVGHLTGRLLLKREGYSVNIPKIIDACIANKKIIELNAHPMRLDMDWRFWHKAKEKGLKCSINPDAHSTSDLLFFRTGINIARKGWLEKQDVINTLPLAKIKSLF